MEKSINENFFKKLKSIPKATKLAFKIKNMIGKGKGYDYILAVLLQEIPNSTEEQIKKILDPFWEQHKPDTSSEDNISNQLDNLLSQEKLKENMKNQTEKSRWAKLAGLPKKETKQQLDENVVGIGAVNQIFPVREPQAYETAFEHYLGEMYDSKAAERDDADHIDALEKDMEYDAIKEGVILKIYSYDPSSYNIMDVDAKHYSTEEDAKKAAISHNYDIARDNGDTDLEKEEYIQKHSWEDLDDISYDTYRYEIK